MKALSVSLASLVVTASLLVVAPVSASPAPAHSSGDQAAPATAARGKYPTKMKCYDDSRCTRLNKRLPTKYVATWSGVVENNTDRWIRNASCKSRVSETQEWGLSTSLSAEVKAGIFASINATIAGSVKKSMTTEIEFSVPFDVPPHTDTTCTQGIAVFRWQALHFDRVRQSAYNFTVKAPRTVSWRIRDVG